VSETTTESPAWAAKFRGFLELLETTRTWHRILRNQEDALTLLVALPGYYYEVDFRDDGDIDVQEFALREVRDVEAKLEDLVKAVAIDLEDEDPVKQARRALGLSL